MWSLGDMAARPPEWLLLGASSQESSGSLAGCRQWSIAINSAVGGRWSVTNCWEDWIVPRQLPVYWDVPILAWPQQQYLCSVDRSRQNETRDASRWQKFLDSRDRQLTIWTKPEMPGDVMRYAAPGWLIVRINLAQSPMVWSSPSPLISSVAIAARKPNIASRPFSFSARSWNPQPASGPAIFMGVSMA